MWSLEKRDLRERCYRTRLLELQQSLQHSGGSAKKRRPAAIWPVRPVRRAVWPVHRAVWPVHPVSLEIPPMLNLEQGQASKSSWPSMRRREQYRSRRNGQMKPKVPNQHQHLVGNRILAYVKVIVLLCQILSRLLRGSGHILIIIHLWIIVGCICNHIIFNIFLCTQIVFHKDWLAIIWSKKILIAARRVKRTWSKIQNTYSWGGVPQAYLTLKRGGCNVCASKNWWSNKWRSSQ